MKHTSTILIVDDEPTARATLEALLISENHTLAFANNGAEALSKAAQLMPDLILLDVMMPDMDGFEVCQQLRASSLLAQVPIIMVTALDDRASRLRGLKAGADDFVSKPYDRAELQARVSTTLQLNRYRQIVAERAKFEWVVQHASDGYVLIDENDAITYANSQARLYLNLPEDDKVPITAKFMSLIASRFRCEPEDAWANWPTLASQPADSAQAVLYLVMPESPTAQAFWLQVNLLNLPLGSGNKLVRLRDVTMQMTLRRNIWGLHSAVNHKLRSPLVILLNSLELQARQMPDLSTAQVTELAQMALGSAQRLRSNIGDILQYLNAPALNEPRENFSLSQLEQMVDEICTYVGLGSLKLSIEKDLLEADITLSKRAIELTLWEILENSKKFHPAQVPQVELRVSRSGVNHICLQVCDDGVTLSPEQLAYVWMPYYQGEKYFTGQLAGMGLGLPMVASLVWSVGGTCRLYNRENTSGVIVELVLPLTDILSGPSVP